MASAMRLFEIGQFGLERKHLVTAQTLQKFQPRHSGELCRAARGQPPKFIKLYRRQHTHLTAETVRVGLLSEQDLLRHFNNNLLCGLAARLPTAFAIVHTVSSLASIVELRMDFRAQCKRGDLVHCVIRPYTCSTKHPRRGRSSWYGKIPRAACPRARRCAPRNNPAAPGEGSPADVHCDRRRKRPGPC